MTHVFDYLESRKADPIAREFLEHATRSAIDRDPVWLAAHRPTVRWRGSRYLCVGASRLGDVWLKGRRVNGAFYDYRVDIDELSDWRRPLTPSEILQKARALVDQQAEDEGLWFRAEQASEAYLQQALRKLHALLEGVDSPDDSGVRTNDELPAPSAMFSGTDFSRSEPGEFIIKANGEHTFKLPEPIPYPSLRDRFAMAALAGMLACGHRNYGTIDDVVSHASRVAYEYADAMLAERENEKEL